MRLDDGLRLGAEALRLCGLLNNSSAGPVFCLEHLPGVGSWWERQAGWNVRIVWLENIPAKGVGCVVILVPVVVREYACGCRLGVDEYRRQVVFEDLDGALEFLEGQLAGVLL